MCEISSVCEISIVRDILCMRYLVYEISNLCVSVYIVGA